MSTKDKARIAVDVIFDEQTLFRNCSNLLIREKSNYVRQQSFRILEEKAQRDVVDQIDETGAYPSHAQTIRMRKALSRENAITKWSERLWKKKTESKT